VKLEKPLQKRGIVLPGGLFWFAWTSQPSIHFIVPILAGIPTGMGVATVMQGLVQYLMDAYSIYCASAIASTVLLRPILAAIFALISPPMFSKLGASGQLVCLLSYLWLVRLCLCYSSNTVLGFVVNLNLLRVVRNWFHHQHPSIWIINSQTKIHSVQTWKRFELLIF